MEGISFFDQSKYSKLEKDFLADSTINRRADCEMNAMEIKKRVEVFHNLLEIFLTGTSTQQENWYLFTQFEKIKSLASILNLSQRECYYLTDNIKWREHILDSFPQF